MRKNYFNLNIEDRLFETLSTMPQWWCELIRDKELYVNIRKNNRINVYYRGASIMSLCCKRDKVEAEIHSYYLGFEKELCDKLGVKYGNVKLQPEEIICRLPSIKKRVETNKKNIACLEDQELNGKNYSSEKFIQSKMYINDSSYIDSEFALSLDDGTDIRIDLVKISEEGRICFEELKLIDDGRLKPSKGNPAEIMTQMDNYGRFLKEAQELKGETSDSIIVEYYDKVIQIMKKIGVSRIDLKPLSVREYVSLHIKQTYTKKHPERDRALNTIRDVCKKLHSNIDEVMSEYYSLKQ